MADATTAETATETTSETSTTTEAETTAPETDWQSEAEKWKAQSRKNEDRAKENARKAKDFDEQLKASMSDSDRAIAEAREAGKSEALTTVGSRLVDAEIRVATAGRTVDVDALLEGLDRSKFLTDDGEPDSDAITAWVDRIAPAQTETEEVGPLGAGIDLGQGSRANTSVGDDKALENMLREAVDLPKR